MDLYTLNLPLHVPAAPRVVLSPFAAARSSLRAVAPSPARFHPPGLAALLRPELLVDH